MNKIKVLVLGAGGSASTNYVRSLRMAGDFHIIGVDCNKFYLQRAETDEKYLIPKADSPDYIHVLNAIIKATGAEFLHAQNDTEVGVLSENRDKLNIKTFLPCDPVVKICQDKWISRQYWEKSGIEHPRTRLINNSLELERAFLEFKGPVWIRDIKGAGGKGALKTHFLKEAEDWFMFNQGWGH